MFPMLILLFTPILLRLILRTSLVMDTLAFSGAKDTCLCHHCLMFPFFSPAMGSSCAATGFFGPLLSTIGLVLVLCAMAAPWYIEKLKKVNAPGHFKLDYSRGWQLAYCDVESTPGNEIYSCGHGNTYTWRNDECHDPKTSIQPDCSVLSAIYASAAVFTAMGLASSLIVTAVLYMRCLQKHPTPGRAPKIIFIGWMGILALFLAIVIFGSSHVRGSRLLNRAYDDCTGPCEHFWDHVLFKTDRGDVIEHTYGPLGWMICVFGMVFHFIATVCVSRIVVDEAELDGNVYYSAFANPEK